MGKIRLIGAVGIKVRPDAHDFKKELREQIKNLPDYDIEVTIDGDATPVNRKVKEAKAKAEAETINMRIDADYDGVKRGIAKIEGMLKSLDGKEIPVTLDRQGLLKAKRELNQMAKDAKVDFKFVKDEAGYRSVLNKIDAIRRQKIIKQIKFTTDAKSLRAQEKMAKDALAKIDANRTIEIKYGNNYDGIKGAIDDVDKRLEALRELKLKTKLDRASLEAAKKKLLDKLATAKVTMTYVEDKAGYEAVLAKIRTIQRQKLEKKISFKTDDDSLAEEAAKFEQLIKDATPPRQIEIEYHHDRAGLEAAIAKIDEEIKDLAKIKMPPLEADKDSLVAARDELQTLLDAEPITMKYNEDKAGFQSVLKKVRQLQAEKVAIKATFLTDDAALEAMALDMEEKLAGLEEKAKITLHVNNDTNDLIKAIAQVDAALHDLGKIKIETELDETQLVARRAELEQALTNSKFKIELDTSDPNDLTAKRAQVQKMLDSFKPKLELNIENNEESLREALYQIDKHKREAEKNKIKLETESTGLGLMAARLAVASRPRTVPFYIRINEKSLLVAEGILKSLSGFNTLTSLGRQFESIFTNFDNYALKSASLATGLGSIVDTLVHVGTTAFSVGEGVSQMVGLLAVAPALLTTMAAGIFVYTAAFDNFSNAFSEDAKKRAIAMKELPANAAKAVESLRGLYKQIASPVQNAFWETMGTSLQDAINHLIPQVKEGLIGMASGAGKFTAGILDSFTEIAQSGELKTMFANITTFFDKTGQAAKPFFDGFNQFGIRGSEFLPKLADWLLKMGTRFDDWATKSAQNGDITRWINEGVQSLKDMWDVGGSVIRMFQGITKAALTAGGSTLTEFSENISRIADMMNGEPFQSRMAHIFKGARDGAHELNVGVKDLGESLGRSSVFLGGLLTQLGKLGGSFLTNVSFTVDSPALKSGITDALQGIETMVRGLQPSFRDLGTIIGGLGVIAGSVFSGMAPLINTVVGYIAQLVTTLGGNLAQTATALIEGMTGRVQALAVPVGLVANGLNSILGFFNALPEEMQEILVAAGVFLLLRGQLGKMMEAIGNSRPFTRMRDNWRMAESAAGRYGTAQERQFRVTTALYEGSGRGIRDLGTRWQTFTGQVGAAQGVAAKTGVVFNSALGTIKGALGGITSFLGGPLGVAIAAVTIIGSVIGERMAAAKAKVDNLVGSLDKMTGSATAASMEILAKDWMQLDDDGVDAFWRGAKNASDAVKILGINSQETTRIIASGGREYDVMVENLKRIRDGLQGMEGSPDGGIPVATMSMEELATATGKSVEQLQQMSAADMTNLINQIEGGRKASEIAEEKVRLLAEATGLGVGTAGDLAVAFETFGRKGATAAEQISSIKTQLDILKGGALSQQEAARAFESAWEGALGTIDKARETTDANGVVVKKSLDYLVDSKGKITDFKGAGGELFDATKQIADAQLNIAESTYQAVLKQTGSTDAATKAAVKALEMTPAQLQTFADHVGISTEKAKALLGNFFGEKWEMRAIFSGESKLFFEEKKKAEDAGRVFDEQAWEAVLRARDETEGGTTSAREGAKAFSTGDYIAELAALPDEALAKIALAVGAGDAYKRGDYSGILKAIDGTNPGVLAALSQIHGVTNGDYKAAIKAFLDELSKQQTDRDLAALAAKQRTAIIDVFFGPPQNEPPASIKRPTSGVGSENGSILDRFGRGMFGFNPQRLSVSAFANGGISVEKPSAAKIYSAAAQFRVFAEPSTGGEAFIPMSASKRERSTQILNEVATQFGYKLTKATAFENGGIMSGGNQRATSGLQVHIGTFNQNTNDTIEDVGRGIMRQARNAGVSGILEGI